MFCMYRIVPVLMVHLHRRTCLLCTCRFVPVLFTYTQLFVCTRIIKPVYSVYYRIIRVSVANMSKYTYI